MQMITIAVDVMGGDNAPGAIVEGCLMGLRQMSDIAVTLCGPEDQIRPLLAGADDLTDRIKIVHAPDVISMHEAPMMAVRKKVDSSMVRAMLELKETRTGLRFRRFHRCGAGRRHDPRGSYPRHRPSRTGSRTARSSQALCAD